jgi:hypothetical protein
MDNLLICSSVENISSISAPPIPPSNVLISGLGRNLSRLLKFFLSSPYRHIFPRIENPFPKVQSPPEKSFAAVRAVCFFKHFRKSGFL